MISREIKEYGYSIGYSKVGITSADGFPDYIKEVESRGDEFDIFSFTTTNPMKDAMPKTKMPDAKSIIVLVWDYFQYNYPENLKQIMGKAYLDRISFFPLSLWIRNWNMIHRPWNATVRPIAAHVWMRALCRLFMRHSI